MGNTTVSGFPRYLSLIKMVLGKSYPTNIIQRTIGIICCLGVALSADMSFELNIEEIRDLLATCSSNYLRPFPSFINGWVNTIVTCLQKSARYSDEVKKFELAAPCLKALKTNTIEANGEFYIDLLDYPNSGLLHTQLDKHDTITALVDLRSLTRTKGKNEWLIWRCSRHSQRYNLNYPLHWRARMRHTSSSQTSIGFGNSGIFQNNPDEATKVPLQSHPSKKRFFILYQPVTRRLFIQVDRESLLRYPPWWWNNVPNGHAVDIQMVLDLQRNLITLIDIESGLQWKTPLPNTKYKPKYNYIYPIMGGMLEPDVDPAQFLCFPPPVVGIDEPNTGLNKKTLNSYCVAGEIRRSLEECVVHHYSREFLQEIDQHHNHEASVLVQKQSSKTLRHALIDMSCNLRSHSYNAWPSNKVLRKLRTEVVDINLKSGSLHKESWPKSEYETKHSGRVGTRRKSVKTGKNVLTNISSDKFVEYARKHVRWDDEKNEWMVKIYQVIDEAMTQLKTIVGN